MARWFRGRIPYRGIFFIVIIVAFAIEGAITGKGLLRPWPRETEESSESEVPPVSPAAGRSLTVYVRDTRDVPVCSARVRVFGRAGEHVVILDGVQELSLLTDGEGRIDIPDVPLGELEVRAYLGSRRAVFRGDPEGSVVLRLTR